MTYVLLCLKSAIYGGDELEVGVVVWVKGLTVKFRIKKGIIVERGQLLKIYSNNIKYIIRVYDFEPEILLSPMEIARISSKREKGRNIILYENDVRLYDTALATIVAQIDEDRIPRGPSSVPSLFSIVEPLDKDDLEQLNLDTGDLKIGNLRVGHKATSIVVSLKGNRVIPHHLLISGVTGSGKSNFGKVLAYAIMKLKNSKYSLVLFDCESEYLLGGSSSQLGLAHAPEAEEKLFYISNLVDEISKIKFSFNYDGIEITREIMAHPLEIDMKKLHPYDFILTGEFSAPQEEALWLAWKTFSEDWLIQLLNTPSSVIYARLKRLVHKNTINTTKRKLKYLLGNGYIFKEDCSTDLISAVLSNIKKGKVILFDIPNATEGEEKLLSVLVARRIFSAYERLKKEAPELWEELPYVLITVEEAHKYLSKNALSGISEIRENIFSIISKRGRKYKVGAMYITQMPGELIEPVIRQTLTKVILPLPTKPDISKIIQYSPYLEDSEEEIKTLDKGEAIIVSPISGLKFAIPVKIFLYEELISNALKREIRIILSQKVS